MGLKEIVLKLQTLAAEKADELERHTRAIDDIDKQIAALKEQKSLVGAGLDSDQIKLAESVIQVQGDPGQTMHGQYSDQNRTGNRDRAIEDAIVDIAQGCPKLKSEYIGVKNYAHFGDQREDHRYGMGPKHGSIVFAIRLKVRDRDLTNDETEAALYYLNSINEIFKAKQQVA